MPNGFSKYRNSTVASRLTGRTNAAARAAAVSRARARNQPVKKALTMPKRTSSRRPTKYKNKSAILVLSRQVKALQNSKFGDRQSIFMTAKLTDAVGLPTADAPVTFMLNDFYDANPIYRGTVTSDGHAGYISVGTWQKPTYKSGLQDAYEWTARMNEDTVSTIEYVPISRKLFMNFSYTIPAGTAPVRLRVTIFRTKRQPVATAIVNYAMPYALGAYRYMSVPAGADYRNIFSPKYHSVLQDKWMTIRSPATGSTKSTRSISIPYAFPQKSLKPDFNSNPTGQKLWTNLPQDDCIWCLISTSELSPAIITEINMSSYCSYRDHHGIEG